MRHSDPSRFPFGHPFSGACAGSWVGFATRRGSCGRGSSYDRSGVWSDWFGSPPPRAERGGVRYLVLDAVAAQPRHGYEIISVIEEKSRGGYRPSPGVIYPTLQMLDELQHIRSVEIDGRKVYEITDAGRIELEAHRDEVDEFYARLLDDSWDSQVENFGEIARRFGSLFKAFRRAARRGQVSPTTMGRVGEIVDEAIQKLEKLFEEER